jgi:hypothetical protein
MALIELWRRLRRRLRPAPRFKLMRVNDVPERPTDQTVYLVGEDGHFWHS